MSKRVVFIGISGWAMIILILGCVRASGENQKNLSEIKAVINYSVAPWDGTAYEILIPLKEVQGASNPFIRINIWGNPEFKKHQIYKFTGVYDSEERGKANFQPILNKSLPEILEGTVSFKSLQKGRPVLGTFDLMTLTGKVFKGEFKAVWGNKELPYIR